MNSRLLLLFFLFVFRLEAHRIPAVPAEDKDLRALVVGAAAGDTLTFAPGVYRLEQELLIDKPLTLLADSGAVLDGGNKTGLLWIASNQVTVKGFRLMNVPRSYVRDLAAILVEEAERVNIEQNTLENTFFGIYLRNAHCISVVNNNIRSRARAEHSSANAIHAWKCTELTVSGNHTSGHRDGIYLEFVDFSHISGNTSENNLRYGLHFMFSDHCAYVNNTFRTNGAGVAVMFSSFVDMYGNRFTENWGMASYGLLLKEIKDSRIANNRFTSNTIGIYAEGAMRMDVYGNDFRSNGWALSVRGSCMENAFTGNNFVGNTFQLTTESKRNANRFDRNYWDDYSGYDLDNNGLGDVPHRPVNLYAYLAQKIPASMSLLRSPLVNVLDRTERLMPQLSPVNLADENPLMRPL